ncbi:protein Wnt-7b [Exaiptasia diaphana]|uniref:Protein Wnt n=1 Tax=Exaiptasia diaphana TaxID=2652724 RepID=A0A913YGA0_EXADI|nr:protein Wnt-7b [Exaiptasia diaphana]
MRLLYGTVMLLFLVVFTESRPEDSGNGSLSNVYKSGMSKDAEQNCTAGIHKWFTKDDLQLCYLYKLKGIVEKAVSMALKHCQRLFRDRRWNCSELNTTKVFQHQGIMKKGIRESAFVYAITSAAVAYDVTKHCNSYVSNGMYKCGCNTGNSHSWTCYDFDMYLKYGEEVSRRYMDPPKHDELSLLIQHNNEAGRQALKGSLQRVCTYKQFGYFGNFREICWRKLPSFNRVAGDLLKKFERSWRVRANRTLERYSDKRRPSRTDLVYTDHSPSFCRPEPSLGTAGTRGRLCKKNAYGSEGCKRLCCGRGFSTSIRLKGKKCECELKGCCKLYCKFCDKNESIEDRCI